MAAAAQMVMPFGLAASYAAEDFLPGDANANALNLMQRWPDWPYSLVLLHGPQGCGKTHLAHVFAQRAQAMFIPPARIGQVPADQLLSGGHSWVIDGIEGVKNPAALAQLINHARARGDYILLTAREAAPALQVGLPDLQSRLNALPSVGLGTPDEALLTGVLAKSFADRQLRVGADVLAYAVARLERSYAAVQEFARLVDEASLAEGRKVTLPLIRSLLREPPEAV